MKADILLELRDIISVQNQGPALSVLLPVKSYRQVSGEINYSFKMALKKARAVFHQKYSNEQYQLLTDKFQKIISTLEIPKGSKSIIIYISENVEKVLLVDFIVNERIIIDHSFEIRDIVRQLKVNFPFLLLILTAKGNQFFFGTYPNMSLTPAVSKSLKPIDAFYNDAPERVANFSDIHERKQAVIISFLRYTDKKLGNLIHEHHLPVLVVGADKLIGYFKSVTRHWRSIIGYVHGNFKRLPMPELLRHIEPHIDLRQKHQDKILNYLKEESVSGDIITGADNVWKEMLHGKGRMLIVEESYQDYEEYFNTKSNISIKHDRIDDIIEVALKKGCEIEFVEDGILEDYGKIALIEHH